MFIFFARELYVSRYMQTKKVTIKKSTPHCRENRPSGSAL
jgi:hypothetical protein